MCMCGVLIFFRAIIGVMQHLNYLINQKCLLFNYSNYPNISSRQSLG